MNTSSFELDSWSFEYNKTWNPNLPDTPTYRIVDIGDGNEVGTSVTNLAIETYGLTSLLTTAAYNWVVTSSNLGYTTV